MLQNTHQLFLRCIASTSTTPASFVQLAGLTNLQHLVLDNAVFPSTGYDLLTSLASLAHLVLVENAQLPSCLSSLTQLCSLVIFSRSVGHDTGALEGALPQLRQLEQLLLFLSNLFFSSTALASLSQLCTLWWDPHEPGTPLPPGPWLAQLQKLVAPWQVLSSSLAPLSGAARLQELGVSGGMPDADAVCSILRWAAKRPSLRRLLLGKNASAVISEALEAVAAALRCKPALTIEDEGAIEMFAAAAQG